LFLPSTKLFGFAPEKLAKRQFRYRVHQKNSDLINSLLGLWRA
jgi:hypothetical protein